MSEPDEKLGGLALRRVPVVLGDDPLELGQAHPHRVVDFAGEELVLLDHRRPELGLPRHDRVEDALLVVDEVVLLEDAQLEPAGISIEPASQSSWRASISISVDLPAPLAPVTP